MALLQMALLGSAARAEWVRGEHTIAWRAGTNIVWQFTFDPARGKPYFHPLGAGGHDFTNFKPEDHPWHYGLWFSWKYINGVNYWEEDRQTGRAEGATRWSAPRIDTRDDGSATIRLNVNYMNPSNRVDLSETRELIVSAPRANGGYTIDWNASFVAGEKGAVLDRTPMPGEPNGRVNGGYAGLGLRMPSPPLNMAVLCSTGMVTRFESDRARPTAPALACNFTENGRDAGGVAIFSHPGNIKNNTPWYIVDSAQMRFACAAILAPEIRTVPATGTLELRYRVAVRPTAWTVEELQRTQPWQ